MSCVVQFWYFTEYSIYLSDFVSLLNLSSGRPARLRVVGKYNTKVRSRGGRQNHREASLEMGLIVSSLPRQ